MRYIKVSQGYSAVVDNEDYDRLIVYRWYALKTKYKIYAKNENHVLMHRMVLNHESRLDIDHKNGNGLDNRKKNLRICTRSQNNYNQKPRNNRKYKGVRQHYNKWVARIRYKGREIHLGSYETEELAARAYDVAAKELAGNFAKLNFPKRWR